jgi:SAM-dependent methyltransferase
MIKLGTMPPKPSTASDLSIYACPVCKRLLRQEEAMLRCLTCPRNYPISNGIPDFILEELSRSADPELRRMRFIDRMARIYETRLGYPIVLSIYGGFHSPSLAQLIGTVSQTVQSAKGRVLDIACGPGTYGRRIASPSREVFGIDISMGMLRQGAAYVAKEGIPTVHFARARVEALPFEDGLFDAVLCCGSLHLFTDTVIALREMARVMKPAAILSVFTFAAGRGGILKFRPVREWSRRHHGLHVFELPEMEHYLTASGFNDFQPEISGSILTFSARERAT